MIDVENLTVRVGQFRLENVSFSIPAGSYGVLMGKTGGGKTTLLESLLGLREIEAGRVLLAGRDVTALDPAERGAGFVPQDGALFSRMTVAEHLGFSLRIRRVAADVIGRRVQELAALLEIGPLLERRPQGLSGGERQRVALGRALSFRPAVLCLDEPLSALDAETRATMCDLLRTVRRETGVTVLHVTHSQQEAQLLADRVLLLRDGQVVQVGSRQ